MESRRIAAGAVLLAAVVLAVFNSSVSSCVPDDFGRCEKVREQVRFGWLGGGGRGNATLVLAENQAALQDNLLDFVYGNLKSGYGQNDIGEPLTDSLQRSANAKSRRADQLSPVALTDVELDRTLKNLYERYPDDSLNRSRRIAVVEAELSRRKWQRVVYARLAPGPLALANTQPYFQAPAKPIAKAPAKPVAKAPAPAAPQAAAGQHVPSAPAVSGSADPFNAPAPSGQQVYISPRTSVWYGISDRGRRLNISMNADRQLGLVMAVYGPDIADVWSSRPTGQGAPGQGMPYFWTGRAKFKGIWKIRITNPNDFSVPYTLTAANISDKNGDLCRDCHGQIGDDQFEKCEHEGDFCEDLKDQNRN